MKKIKLLAAALLICGTLSANDIIPKPVSVEKGSGVFMLTPAVWINFASLETRPLADYLAAYLPGCRTIHRMTEYSTSARMNGHIYLEIDGAMSLPTEGYRISVTGNRVKITGKDYGGLFNGIQTFLQLLPPEVYQKSSRNFSWPVAGVIIEDYPRFAYRGMMLDVARTFIPKEGVMRFIDNIAYHKINKFHWHLSDDEGWRIEIESYPKLTSVGAWRGAGLPVKPIYGAWDDECYGGFYTQADIREIVAYAATRNIEIIPEIDIPGHSRAAAIAYPEILCNYTPDLTSTAGYDRRNVWCVAREENYKILSGILKEIAALFPSGRVHLGGDEVETGQWSRCPDCKALMAAKGIAKTVELEDVFMERAVDIARKSGMEAGIWEEVSYRGKPDRSVLVYSWKGDMKTTRKVASDGYPTVVMPAKYFYFDMKQSPSERGLDWAGIVSTETVYSFDFGREGFTDGEMRNMVGLEGAFFSELLIANGPDYLDYQLFPRTCALAEAAWTPQEHRSWNGFEERLARGHNARMRAMGIEYRTPPAAATPQPPKKTPAVAFTSSLAESAKHPFTNVSSYRDVAPTAATCRNGDWFMWKFAEPLACGTIRVGTGYEHLQRAGVPQGYVEVSYDGTSFERAGNLTDGGKLIFRPERAVRAIRIVSETEGNGEPFVIIQPLQIR